MSNTMKQAPTNRKADAGAKCSVGGGYLNNYKDRHNATLLQIPIVEAQKWQNLSDNDRRKAELEWRKAEQLRRLMAGERVTAYGLNKQIGFYDAQKFMSDVRKWLLQTKTPFEVCTYTLPSRRVVYYLNPISQPNTSTAQEGGQYE